MSKEQPQYPDSEAVVPPREEADEVFDVYPRSDVQGQPPHAPPHSPPPEYSHQQGSTPQYPPQQHQQAYAPQYASQQYQQGYAPQYPAQQYQQGYAPQYPAQPYQQGYTPQYPAQQYQQGYTPQYAAQEYQGYASQIRTTDDPEIRRRRKEEEYASGCLPGAAVAICCSPIAAIALYVFASTQSYGFGVLRGCSISTGIVYGLLAVIFFLVGAMMPQLSTNSGVDEVEEHEKEAMKRLRVSLFITGGFFTVICMLCVAVKVFASSRFAKHRDSPMTPV